MTKTIEINFFHIWNPSFWVSFSIFTFLDGGDREFIQKIVNVVAGTGEIRSEQRGR